MTAYDTRIVLEHTTHTTRIALCDLPQVCMMRLYLVSMLKSYRKNNSYLIFISYCNTAYGITKRKRQP